MGEELYSSSGVCDWYFTTIMLDTTLGTALIVAMLKFLDKINASVSQRCKVWLTHGDYRGQGVDFNFERFFKQLITFLTIVSIMKILMVLLTASLNTEFGDLAASVFSFCASSPDLKLFFVMVLIPALMNTFQFWLVDSALEEGVSNRGYRILGKREQQVRLPYMAYAKNAPLLPPSTPLKQLTREEELLEKCARGNDSCVYREGFVRFCGEKEVKEYFGLMKFTENDLQDFFSDVADADNTLRNEKFNKVMHMQREILGFFEKFDASGSGKINKKDYMRAAYLLLDDIPEFAKYMVIAEDDLQTGVGRYRIHETVWVLDGLNFGDKQNTGKTQTLSRGDEVEVRKVVCPKPKVHVRGYVKLLDNVQREEKRGTINLWSRSDDTKWAERIDNTYSNAQVEQSGDKVWGRLEEIFTNVTKFAINPRESFSTREWGRYFQHQIRQGILII